MVYSKRRLLGWMGFVIFALLVPFAGMRFTNEINWDLSDFIIMGSVLGGIGLFYEGVIRRSQRMRFRLAWMTGILGAFLLFWVNGAVGMIGHENQEANVLYRSVLAVLLVGALISRCKSKGMAITMFLMAIVQMAVPVTALIIWPPSEISWAPSVFGVFLLSSFFAFLFFISGVLFKRSHRREKRS